MADNTEIIWKPSTEYDKYEISNMGQIRAKNRNCGKI